MVAKKKIKTEAVSQLLAPQGAWYAVIDDGDTVGATPVALWASGTSGVFGLVSIPGQGSRLAPPNECLGYVLVPPGENPHTVAYQYYEDAIEEEEDEDGDEDDEEGDEDEKPPWND